MTSLSIAYSTLNLGTKTPSLETPPEYVPRGKIHIINFVQGGYGDVVCAIKIIQLLVRIGIPLGDILLTGINYKEKNLKLIEKIGPINFQHITATNSLEAERVRHIVCTLTIPVIGFNIEPLKAPIYEVCLRESPETHIYEISEYGGGKTLKQIHPSIPRYSMGLSCKYKEIGLLLSPELIDWSRSQANYIPLKKLYSLLKLNPNVKTAILRSRVSNILSIVRYIGSNRLYYGYSNSAITATAFAVAICAVDKLKVPKKNITIFFPIRETENFNLIVIRALINLRNQFSLHNIGTLIIKSLERTISTDQINNGSTKTLTLICGAISHNDSISLWKASELEVLSTGDQSLSEAISANKCLAYESLGHKTQLADDLTSLFKKTTSRTLQLAFDFSDGYSTLEKNIKAMTALFKANFKHPGLFYIFNNEIITNHDCSQVIRQMISNSVKI